MATELEYIMGIRAILRNLCYALGHHDLVEDLDRIIPVLKLPKEDPDG